MFDKCAKSRVLPISFTSLDGDFDQNQSREQRHSRKNAKFPPENSPNTMTTNHQEHFAKARKQAYSPRRDFLPPDYSFPAVVLEDVCFSVDRSQQQSNFLNECLARLNQCLSPICSGSDQEATQKVQILKSVNLRVPHGTIFGLLGPSSCGKTTLLRCLVGLLKPNSGVIHLFGSEAFRRTLDESQATSTCGLKAGVSRRNDCRVPGPNVGYMPQDLGLYEDFTIAQLLTMFGNYMRMDSKLIEARIEFMAGFLELPEVDRTIQTLSGGQKRRVSFAIACLHMPPLIILDEPTVGVDPLLRRSIWKYLRRLASEENKTIIITTHYIEEAAQADQVALMRAGRILVQDSPRRIIKSNNSRTLEEAFLKICNNVQDETNKASRPEAHSEKLKIIAQPKFHWPLHLAAEDEEGECKARGPEDDIIDHHLDGDSGDLKDDSVISELKLRAQKKLAIYDELRCNRLQSRQPSADGQLDHDAADVGDNFCSAPDALKPKTRQPRMMNHHLESDVFDDGLANGKAKRDCLFRKNKFVMNVRYDQNDQMTPYEFAKSYYQTSSHQKRSRPSAKPSMSDISEGSWRKQISKNVILFWALLYKNYRRNVNSIPLLAFQFMLPMIQMISFSLCVGGRPTNVGLGIVNRDNPISFLTSPADLAIPNLNNGSALFAPGKDTLDELYLNELNDSLSLRYMSFIDGAMLNVQLYDDMDKALADVRSTKLWAVLEIGENFTVSIAKRFDLENFYQLDLPTIHQSVIKLYPDRSNKILDMLCQRSLVDSYRKFLSDEFEHFKRLPIEIARPIFDIKPNVISNSIDGYTESIAPGLLASLTYIMAAGLTTFIMVVERSAGILERTYTSGINPVSYLLAHALFRSAVMMIQIGFVLGLTFYVLKQPLVGSIWLAYFMLMILNVTGIAYGLLISSIVTDQNGAALTIVSSLVVKITLSGILWPFEAIPHWLRTICYIQPLTMPVQALKAITLKGAVIGDRSVNLGFLVSISWLVVFLTISAKRFKFYQH